MILEIGVKFTKILIKMICKEYTNIQMYRYNKERNDIGRLGKRNGTLQESVRDINEQT